MTRMRQRRKRQPPRTRAQIQRPNRTTLVAMRGAREITTGIGQRLSSAELFDELDGGVGIGRTTELIK